ncbi:major facilitator superfamily transporter [Colletotrichum sublineola]|uniref:Putative major facilitator superfamily transporter n=1 Tax=Colletotrichum sublineola TaxID=1173701 RepID=A0A066XHR8_COLSU|nr:major facilitator superfamily transporter [Colletotrichum sublineola]KDN68708.1 putative major facilitator superfamily transporter [Colletotrichum sublineola]
MSSETVPWLLRLGAESGFTSIIESCRDTKVLCLQRFVRLFAYGASFLILVQFLSSLDFSDERIGLFMTLTLLGDVLISFLLTAITDQVGRRKVLAAGAVSMMMSGLVFSLADNYWILVAASILGVISPSGNEIGPFRAVEESILAQLTVREKRSDIFAWYTLFGSAGAAFGTLTCGWAVQVLQHNEAWTHREAYRVVFLIYAGLGALKLLLITGLTSGVEASPLKSDGALVRASEEHQALLADSSGRETHPRQSTQERSPLPSIWERMRALVPYISPLSRSILFRLLLLFCIDSFASGMASPSWLTYFFTTVHSLQPGSLGTLFLVTNLLATISNIAALPLARRLGPLKTMVYTHLPSAIFLSMIPLPSASPQGTWVAMTFLSLRACTQSMDQAPRQAFLAAAVLPSERTAVLGVVNTVKTLAQASGIGSAGFLSGRHLWIVILSGAGIMKAVYDLLMLAMFLGLRDREGSSTKSHSRDEEDL